MARRRPGPKLPAAIFIAEDRQKAYAVLERSTRAEDRQLFAQLQKAIGTLTEDVFAGIQIPRDRIPAEYHRRFPNLESLWKMNLTRNWRLIYSVAGEGGAVVLVIEWLSHTEYERRFNY